MTGNALRRVIVNGDDFGLAVPVNEAIVEAHLRGVLTTASLMVGAAAAEDAVARARRAPSLKVGLHLVLVEGRAVLPREAIPKMVDRSGEFSRRPALAGCRYAVVPGIRRQMQAEIRAQFEAFRKTGLTLDHVDTHNHLHLHPRILNLILEVGREYGLAAVRVPNEPPLASWRAARNAPFARTASWLALSPLIAYMKWRLRRNGIRYNDFVFGMADTGRMKADLLLRILRHLPKGTTEIYFHPASRRCPETERTMPDYCHVEELAALTDERVRAAFADGGIPRISFRDL